MVTGASTRAEEIENLRNEIAELQELLKDDVKLKQYIISTLQTVKKTYGKPRKTELVEKLERELDDAKKIMTAAAK